MRVRPAALVVLAVIGIALPAGASDQAIAKVTVAANVSTRTSLHVSSELLTFDVGGPGAQATAAVDFTAGARVPTGSLVMLTVEPLQAVSGPGGAADVETAVTFDGEGPGTLGGTLAGAPAVAARWHGSGFRQGRFVFTLHAAADGHYTVPVRFVISTP
ncbi:MAG TPA: hypothetical protein VF159_02810 [Gemmatimonadaceae bacterium]